MRTSGDPRPNLRAQQPDLREGYSESGNLQQPNFISFPMPIYEMSRGANLLRYDGRKPLQNRFHKGTRARRRNRAEQLMIFLSRPSGGAAFRLIEVRSHCHQLIDESLYRS
jgi:hypothetical protein